MLDNTAYAANGPATGYSTLGTASARSTPAYAGADQARPARRLENIIADANQLVQMSIDARVMLGDNIDRLIGAQPAAPSLNASESTLSGCEVSELDLTLSRLRAILLDIRDHAQRLTSI